MATPGSPCSPSSSSFASSAAALSVLLLLLLSLSFVSVSRGITDPADVAALKALNNEVKKASKNRQGIPGWFRNKWHQNPCGSPYSQPRLLPFPGVMCPYAQPNETVRVYSLVLYNTGLSATNIAPITGLSALTALLLTSNNFSGPIPPGLGSLPLLANIDMRNNRLSGSIPDDIGNAPLATLLLSNQTWAGEPGLTGPIPTTLSRLTRLSILDLSYNSLNGSIPSTLTGLPLTTLLLRSNKLTGALPSLLPLRKTLQTLDISRNPFKPGPMPKQLNKLNCLSGTLDLSYMGFHGAQASLANLGAVVDLMLDGNALSGAFKPQLLPQGSLGYISAKNNKFSGGLSSGLLSVLNYNLYCMTTCGVNLGGNHFSGPLPPNLGDILQAFVFDFSNNQFNGTIPDKYSYVYSTLQLLLQNNRLTGPMPSFDPPPSVTYQLMLEQLDVSGNLLSGPFPEKLTRFTRLRSLRLSNNQLYGTIPNVSALAQLTFIDVSRNRFSGVPPAFPAAKVLDISYNYFGGLYANFSSSFGKGQAVNPRFNCFRCTPGVNPCRNPRQRTPAACQKFCQANFDVQPPCGPGGVCNVWPDSNSTQPMCKCGNSTTLLPGACPSS